MVDSGPIQSVHLIGSTAAKGSGNDIDLLYDFGNVDLEKYKEYPEETEEEALEHLVETTDTDSESYDSFYKVNGRYFHLSSGAGRSIVENTDYAKDQQGKPSIILASKSSPPSATTKTTGAALTDVHSLLEEAKSRNPANNMVTVP